MPAGVISLPYMRLSTCGSSHPEGKRHHERCDESATCIKKSLVSETLAQRLPFCTHWFPPALNTSKRRQLWVDTEVIAHVMRAATFCSC